MLQGRGTDYGAIFVREKRGGPGISVTAKKKK